MQPYNRAFGTCAMKPNPAGAMVEKCALTPTQQSLISLTIVFIAIGSFVAGFTGNFLGRRGTIQTGALIIAIGAGGMLGTAGNFTAHMACKCIQGFGLGHVLSAISTYGVECVSAAKRGMLMSLFNLGLGFGNMIAAAVCLASSRYTTNAAWQTPVACQLPLSLVLAAGAALFPESPRWLLTKGLDDKARASFAKFLSLPEDSPEVDRQLRDVKQYIELEKAFKESASWLDIFRGSDLRRTLTSVLVAVGIAVTGSKFFSTYAAIFLAGVGISNPYHITLLLAGCVCAGTLFSPFTIEYLGRRYALLIGYGGMGSFMLIVAAVGSGVGATTETARTTLVALLCLWGFLYGGFIGTSLSTTAAEMHSLRLRTFGQSFSIGVYEIFSFGASFSVPYMLSAKYGNMGLNVGYFFAGITTLIWVLVFLFVPETGRMTLEQVDDFFISGKQAWRTSLAVNKKRAAAAGQIE